MRMEMILDKKQIEFYAYLYDRTYPVSEIKLENRIKLMMEIAKIKRRHYMLRYGLKLIAKWKSRRSAGRIDENTVTEIRKATKILFAADIHKKQQKCIEKSLIKLEGVGYAVASTILYFKFPDLYPIIDFRVMEMVGVPIKYKFGKRQNIDIKFSMWRKYVTLCQNTARRCKLTVRDVEKALWKCHQVYDGNMRLIMRLRLE